MQSMVDECSIMSHPMYVTQWFLNWILASVVAMLLKLVTLLSCFFFLLVSAVVSVLGLHTMLCSHPG